LGKALNQGNTMKKLSAKNRSAFCLSAALCLLALFLTGCFQPVELGETYVEKGTAYLRVTNASADDAYVLEGLELWNAEGEVEQSWDWPGLEALEAGRTKEIHTETTGSFTLQYRVKDKDVSGTAVYEGGSVDIKPNSIHEVLFKGEATVTQQDGDGDGLPDDWEREHGFDPNDPGDGNEVHVSRTGDDAAGNGTRLRPYKTLAKAVVKAGQGLSPEARTVVVLGRLTLDEGGNGPGNPEYPGRLDSAFYLGKTRRPVTIGGESPDSIAILTVESLDTRKRRVLYLDVGADVTLRNIKITGGKHEGGGIYAYGANLTLGPGTMVTENESLAYPDADAKDCGGVLVERGSVLTMKGGSSVTLNKGGIGGGVKLIDSRLTMEDNSKINENEVMFGSGGLMVENSTVEMLAGAEISQNTAGTAGNNTGGGGGGVTVEVFSTFTMYMGSKINNNVIHNGMGGGLYVSGESTLVMKGGQIFGNDCIVADNFRPPTPSVTWHGASGRGGGIALCNGSFFFMDGGTIAKNRATRSGGGLYFTEGGTTFVMRGGKIYGAGDPDNENLYLSTDTDTAKGGHAIVNYTLGGPIRRVYDTDVTVDNYP
jgi:hypothetical protein